MVLPATNSRFLKQSAGHPKAYVHSLPPRYRHTSKPSAVMPRTTRNSNQTVINRGETSQLLASSRLRTIFYPRFGTLLMKPRVQLWTVHDAEIWGLFLPALIALILEPLQQMIDAAIVGRLGVPELGAVGLGTVLFQFVVGSFASLLFATTPLVSSDKGQASRLTAHGMWIALLAGGALCIASQTQAPEMIVNLMSAGDTAVSGLAVAYLRARSWGLPAALIMMVAIGASRGHKDMHAPLLGSLVYLIVMAGLDVAFIFGLGMGVEGAGYAATFAQWSGAVGISAVLVNKGVFDPRDLGILPKANAAVPYIQMAPSLFINNLAAMLPMLVATSLATGLGPSHLAAHTVLRQLLGFWWMTFLGFNATAHSMVATALGNRRSKEGAEILVRICELAVALSLPLMTVLFITRSTLPGLFTSDMAVVTEVAHVLPFLLLCMPLDALGLSIEGGILGASDTRWVATRCSWASIISLLALTVVALTNGGLTSIWIAGKLLNLSTLGLDVGRFASQKPKTVRE